MISYPYDIMIMYVISQPEFQFYDVIGQTYDIILLYHITMISDYYIIVKTMIS
jgi:hypothetical protein